ncbi:23408_t:CDS:1 [Gigaspora margarita]|uniref:23408_t:CDS:1 n=1 Tax=Gigaspora margarita TaxID=4874 RepID=A0ABN7WF29_GIGMA|nr:23408_t:CDS:1 [Gigaspora margarita]
MNQIQSDNTDSPLNKHVIFSEPETLLSQQNTTALPTVMRRNNRPKSRKTADAGCYNRKKNHYKLQEKRAYTLDSYTYYHPQSNIYSRSDYKYKCYCCAYPYSPTYGYTGIDDELYDSPSTNSNIFMDSEMNNEKNSGDSEISESGRDITKLFLRDFEAWRETISHHKKS